MVDRTASWAEVIPLAFIACWMALLGVPVTITSNQGPQFTTPHREVHVCETIRGQTHAHNITPPTVGWDVGVLPRTSEGAMCKMQWFDWRELLSWGTASARASSSIKGGGARCSCSWSRFWEVFGINQPAACVCTGSCRPPDWDPSMMKPEMEVPHVFGPRRRVHPPSWVHYWYCSTKSSDLPLFSFSDLNCENLVCCKCCMVENPPTGILTHT